MRAMFLTAIAALTLTSAAEQSGIAEMHRQKLHAAMERYITYEGWAFGPQPNGWFAAVAGKYAQTNQLPFDGIVLLVQEKLEKEYDAFRNGVPPPDDGKGGDRRARMGMSINLLRSLGKNPVSLPFLYRMSRKAEGYYRRRFEDMFYETVEKSPVAAVRETLDTPEKMSQVDIDRLCEMIDNRNRFLQTRQEIGLEDEDDVYRFLLENLPSLNNVPLVRVIDWGLSKRYPEYKTSSQRLAVWGKIKDFTPAPNWNSKERDRLTAQKAELAELAATPPEKRTDMRQRFKNLPPPVVPLTASHGP